ncbi:hypothetical protein IWX90DRAFT_423531, partial [Phyllosticta citrichinensis]
PRKVKGIPRLLLLMRTRFSSRKGMIQQGSFLAALGQRALSDPLSCSSVSLSLPRRGSELHWHAATQNQVRGSDENHSRNAAARVQAGGPGVGTTTSEWTLTDEGIFAIFGRAAHLRVIPIYVLNSDFVAPPIFALSDVGCGLSLSKMCCCCCCCCCAIPTPLMKISSMH